MLMMSLLSVFSNKANWRVLSVMQTTRCLYFHNWLFDLVLNNYIWWASQVVLVVKNLLANAGEVRNILILGSGRSLAGEHGKPLQYSCLENPMERGAWWATVHRSAKSQIWPKPLQMHEHNYIGHWLFTSVKGKILRYNFILYNLEKEALKLPVRVTQK